MAINFNNAYVQQFKAMLLDVMQQSQPLVRSQLLADASRTGVSAVLDMWDRVGNVLLQPIGVHTNTVELNPNHSRRGALMQSRGGGILISKNVDLVRALLNPQSDYLRLLGKAGVQTIDKEVLDQAIGSATTVTTARATGQQTYGTQAMLSAYQIGGATAVDLSRVIATGVLLSKASVPTGAKNRVWFYSPGQETDFMAITQASSGDFTKNKIHDAGGMDGVDWQGFHFVQIPDVVDETTTALVRMLQLPSATERYNIAMYRGGVGLSIGQEITPEISPRADKNNETQVYISLSIGAVRLWEGAVVRVSCLEN